MKKCTLLCIAAILWVTAGAQSVSIIVPQSLRDSSITAITIADVQQLLAQACGCQVTLNDPDAKVIIRLPEISKDAGAQLNRFAQRAAFPYKNYPEHDFSWTINNNGGKIKYELKANTLQGVTFGLYALLQEHLGFRFYHPKRTVVPHWSDGWPAEQVHSFDGKALFDKNGFHLHTQHPLELTEQLLGGNNPHDLNDVKEYINWLVRNGQDFFEFCLLNDVDAKTWPAHAKAMVDYAHSRGILASVDLSLHLIQQKSYELYKGPFNQRRQVEKNLQWLMQADWDFLDMEFSTSEFIAGNKKKKEQLRQLIIQWLQQHSHAKLTGRQHIVKSESELGHRNRDFVWDSASLALDKQRGVLAHTVMFYDMTEPNAPVYENKNQRHMFEFMKQQLSQRETWYFPESAYWVSFDISQPLFLLPYLSARLSDIDTCVKYGVPGHITFSSGWEWGYWLFDWSIARWSWQYSYDGKPEARTPTMYAYQIGNNAAAGALKSALQLQQQYLKDSTLMQWMTAMTVTDEIGIKAISKEYEPRPEWSYKFLEGRAGDDVIENVRVTILPQLDAFATKTESLLRNVLPGDSISAEWLDGIRITGLRARHRYYTLQYILNRREAALKKQHFNGDTLLQDAAAVRSEAQQIVNRRQQHYRYPVSSLATQHWEHTSYHFGYLYMASNLHFWRREEEQARRNIYKPGFMNVWNFWRIAGIIK